jgi:hypothetical protein
MPLKEYEPHRKDGRCGCSCDRGHAHGAFPILVAASSLSGSLFGQPACHARVALSDRGRGMPQDLLHDPDVNALFEEQHAAGAPHRPLAIIDREVRSGPARVSGASGVASDRASSTLDPHRPEPKVGSYRGDAERLPARP